MKHYFLLLLALTLITTSNSQDLPKVEITPEGIQPVVVDVEGKSASDIYQSVQHWIQETYKNPDEVLKANIKDDMIRLDGYGNAVWSTKSIGITSTYDVSYTLTLDFKDGKYRFTWKSNTFWAGTTKALFLEDAFFKKNGDVRKMYIDSKVEYEGYINAINQSIYSYITGKTAKKNDDW